MTAPMVEVIEEQSGQRPTAILADNGYCSDKNLAYLESADEPEKKIEGYVATGKSKHGEHRLPVKPGPMPKGATRVDRMKKKLQTKAGKAVYAARKCVVEPVFGQIKQARGFRQFVLRGLKKVQGEWALLCMTHNILKVYRGHPGLSGALFDDFCPKSPLQPLLGTNRRKWCGAADGRETSCYAFKLISDLRFANSRTAP